MEYSYISYAGSKHNLDIYTSSRNDETDYTIHRNGNLFVDLVRDEDHWQELYEAPSVRADEYGAMLNDFFIIKGRMFRKR